jgi:hypothetical protein
MIENIELKFSFRIYQNRINTPQMSKVYVVVLLLRRTYKIPDEEYSITDDCEILRCITLANDMDDSVIKTLEFHKNMLEKMEWNTIGKLILRVTPIGLDESQAYYEVFDTNRL